VTFQPTAMPASYRFVFDGNNHVCFAVDGDQLGPGLRFMVNDYALARALGAALNPELADLVDIAIAVYAVDRLAPRRPLHADRYHLYWTRNIQVQLPLRVPNLWISTALGRRLHRLLRSLTEDFWEFEFSMRSGRPRPSETMRPLLRTEPVEPVTVGLFSGGLDSLAGACRELLDPAGGTLFLISGRTNSRLGARQDLLSQQLCLKTHRDVRPLVVQFGLRDRGGKQGEDEPSQRSRGFVFPILAAVAALLAGASEIQVYEPGIGAINLPYTDAQLGAQATRATDPRMLIALSEFVTMASGQPFSVRAPYLFATKAELCQSIAALGVPDLAKETVSCDNVSLRVKDHTHCGLCTSCLLRRQGLHGAGLGDLDRKCGKYKDDILAGPGAVRFEKLRYLRAMDHQARKLEYALATADPWQELSRMYPQLVEIAFALAGTGQPVPVVEREIVDLYRRYCAEWAGFRAGIPWALESWAGAGR
jgi:hypothetical protein